MDDRVTAFLDGKIIARGPRETVTRTLEHRYPGDHMAIRVFEDATGRVTDLDYWDVATPAPARGRPKLGVVAREITLLPRQWAWLAAQKGGASATLRRLVDEASKAPPSIEARRDAVYRFLSDLCGDRLGFEEASRALYRGETDRFRTLVSDWPDDIRSFADELLG